VLILLVVLCALAPFAYASPTDPLWVGGIYDAADADDAVFAALSLESRVEDHPHNVGPARVIVDTIPAVAYAVRFTRVRRLQPRAPPES